MSDGVGVAPDALTDDSLLTRKVAAEALTALGYPTSWRTLTVKASRGDGPPYLVYGSKALYR